MNEWLQKLFAQVKELWGKWTTTQKAILLGVVGVFAIALVLLATLTGKPQMAALWGVPIKDQALLTRTVTKLDDEIPGRYQVRPDNVVMVADEQTARSMRALLFREDLVPKDIDPWEVFDTERFTLTDFERRVNLRRALTKSLELHIVALEDVDAANIILDIPEDALFSQDQKPITASVQITPKPGSDITENRKKVEGIVKLVKFAIAGLKDENIVITDNRGVVLNDFKGLADLDRLDLAKRELAEKAKLERQYKAEVLQSLSQFYTRERVEILKLDIDLDMSKESSKTKEFFPITLRPDNPRTPYDESQVIPSTTLSSETSSRDWQGTGINPQGPPGQEGQTPPAYKDLSNLAGTLKEKSEIRNEAINERNTERTERPWNIRRVTASVAIDGTWKWNYDEKGNVKLNPDGSIARSYSPVSPEELRTVEALVRDAIGFSANRGDSVTVAHLQKDRRAEHSGEDDVFRRQKQIREAVVWSLVGLGVILTIVIMVRMLSKYLERRRREKEEELARQHQAMREAALRSAEEQGMDVELSIEDRARQEMQENALNMAREHPEDVAQLIRTWLMEE
jgi:flagellar M-ring protein FliF